jgi:carbon-monoxide dehydrogenase large subunit
VELAEGSARIRGDAGVAIPIAELARMVHFQAHRLDEDLRYGLEARVSYDRRAPSPMPATWPW